MKQFILLACLFLVFSGCHKDKTAGSFPTCDMQKVYAENEKKLSISQGAWGTVSEMTGDFMPVIPPGRSSGKHCPVKRTLNIHAYTLVSQAYPATLNSTFYDSVSTPLVAVVEPDNNGFFQLTLSPGTYSIFIVENGKLYANTSDGQGGLSPFTLTTGTLNINPTLAYKVTY